MRPLIILLLASVLLPESLAQQAPKRLPPPGISVPDSVRTNLQTKLQHLQERIASAYAARSSDNVLQFFPDVQIFEKAVRSALDHNEFFRTNEFAVAEKLISEGVRRAESFSRGEYPWLTSKGLMVRAYQSRLDDSIQPFGLVVPESYEPGSGRRYRLDVWLHGRDETLTELKFMNERSTRPGEFTPPDTFVLHPYGRYCNAFKFAGEIDVLEALEAVMANYPIDRARIVLRGFSMGGAGVWHLATHYSDQWVCAAPGAGFAETARYMRVKLESVPEFERTLWQWYDATDYALNLFDCPTIAYSGELDKQRQAADVMEAALRAEGLPLVHLIGAKTEHRYQSETKRLLSTLVDALAAQGKPQEPEEIRFTTRTLRYPKMHWLTLLGLEKYWSRADVRARLTSNAVKVLATNVTSFALQLSRATAKCVSVVEINGTALKVENMPADPDFLVVSRTNNTWALRGTIVFPTLTKGIGHQGPIDDAFMDRFVFVPPSSNGFHSATTDWIDKEFKRAIFEWRAQFRGDVRVMNDRDALAFTNTDNLILWGDPQSNPLLARILPQLPIKWTADRIEFGGKTFDTKTHVPLLIFPNPLNPEKYIVLNSGFTFRGFGSNADQTPKLPDYALLNVTKEDPFTTGISAAGFFDEQWRLPARDSQ
jgi:hypothetical protein